jgi:hypothetical protein
MGVSAGKEEDLALSLFSDRIFSHAAPRDPPAPVVHADANVTVSYIYAYKYRFNLTLIVIPCYNAILIS